jgi:hypothetical protein
MSKSTLERLEHWYHSQCNGEWEHTYGVTIGTLDNPGWSLCVDLAGTALEDHAFEEYRENFDDPRSWMIYQKINGTFAANGGPAMLDRMLGKFLEWADTVDVG